METKKKIGYIAATVLLVVILVGLLILSLWSPGKQDEAQTQVFDWETVDVRVNDTDSAFVKEEEVLSSETIASEVQDIGLLVTAEYHYRHAESYENTLEAIGVKWNITKTSFVYMIDGDIYAGVDLSQVEVDVDDANKEIRIKLPEAQITSSEIDHDSYETVDSKNGLFNELTADQVNASFAHVKEVENTKAIEGGILDRARANAGQVIETMLLHSFNLKDYTIICE